MALKNLNYVEMLEPNYANVHYLRGVIYERMGLKKEANQEYIKEVNINPRSIHAWRKLKKNKRSGAIHRTNSRINPTATNPGY